MAVLLYKRTVVRLARVLRFEGGSRFFWVVDVVVVVVFDLLNSCLAVLVVCCLSVGPSVSLSSHFPLCI